MPEPSTIILPSQELATLGGGCFWCLEAVFENLRGVISVVSGYAGGALPNPSYRQVCNGNTGHAEVVQVVFDPRTVTYDTVLSAFFATHDPTTRNRQGADVGTQYRSVIFYHSGDQHQSAAALIRELDQAKMWNAPIVTQLLPFEAFYPADEFHQGYYRTNPEQPYCQAVISPKLAKFRQKFADKAK